MNTNLNSFVDDTLFSSVLLVSRLAESVRLMMALSIFLSYALQFYVPIDIAWPAIKAKIPTERMQVIWEYIFRTVLVIITCKTATLFFITFLTTYILYDLFFIDKYTWK